MSTKVYRFLTPKEIALETAISESEILDDIKSGVLAAVQAHSSDSWHIGGEALEKYLAFKNVTHTLKLHYYV